MCVVIIDNSTCCSLKMNEAKRWKGFFYLFVDGFRFGCILCYSVRCTKWEQKKNSQNQHMQRCCVYICLVESVFVNFGLLFLSFHLFSLLLCMCICICILNDCFIAPVFLWILNGKKAVMVLRVFGIYIHCSLFVLVTVITKLMPRILRCALNDDIKHPKIIIKKQQQHTSLWNKMFQCKW